MKIPIENLRQNYVITSRHGRTQNIGLPTATYYNQSTVKQQMRIYLTGDPESDRHEWR